MAAKIKVGTESGTEIAIVTVIVGAYSHATAFRKLAALSEEFNVCGTAGMIETATATATGIGIEATSARVSDRRPLIRRRS